MGVQPNSVPEHALLVCVLVLLIHCCTVTLLIHDWWGAPVVFRQVHTSWDFQGCIGNWGYSTEHTAERCCWCRALADKMVCFVGVGAADGAVL
jgi:hypothetical protein